MRIVKLEEANHPAPPDSSLPAGGLVEQVAVWTLAEHDAKHILGIVANYLEERNDHTGARWLREEVERG